MMKQGLRIYGPYILLSAAIMLPLLQPGYILTLDLVFTPNLRAPSGLSNDWLWQNLLHYANLIIPSQIIEKSILLGILLLASIGMHRLVVQLKTDSKSSQLSWYWAPYIASIFYTANPYTYSRFMTGQYAVLLGYALMPFFTRQLLQFLNQSTFRNVLKLTGIGLLISVISIHTLGELAVITVSFLGVALWQNRHNLTLQKRLTGLLLVGLGIFVVLSCYWLVPLALGKGTTAQTIRQFDTSDSAAFATIGDNPIVKLGNVLKLQGFWADSRSLYLMPQEQLFGWGTLRLLIWVLAGWGIMIVWRGTRGVAAALLAIALLGCIFAVGLPQHILTSLGYREPQKFAGLLALAFAIFLAFGSARLLQLAQNRSETIYSLAASGLILLVILFTPTMYWGFGGQLQASSYPSDWHKANNWLNSDRSEFRTIALPWHQYMSFGFAGRIIGHPAQDFFDKPVITSSDPELGHIGQRKDNPLKVELSSKLQHPDKFLSQSFARHHIKYIMLFKDYDYRKYRYLDRQPGLTTVWDSPSLRIYRNLSIGRAQ